MTTATARTLIAIVSIMGFAETTFAADELPRALDSRLKIELFAEHPHIVTPTGIDVDHRGRVWAIESNTHFPPDGYKGHPSDRILVMQDTNGDHKADKIVVFTDGLKHTMSIAVKPVWLDLASGRRKPADTLRKQETGSRKQNAVKTNNNRQLDVFIATRRAVWLYTDDDGDLKADRKRRIVELDTKGDYPHNGLAGFAFDAMGWMYFGFGENLGANYKLIGSDGVTLSGGGEGGNIYRCRPDGSKLKQWATGFWNPHASCFDAFGRLFTVDNDPHSRPPCRLLHVIKGGDYGYRYRNGRQGLHPFTAWNGEIPGTLPMVSGTGEAPSGIVAYEADGFPKDYVGNLLVGSWGDHRIDRFRLKPRGTSFESLPETIIQGGDNFRPVGLAVAPDGSLYCTDWVKRDYKLHGHGRVWRISLKDEPQRKREVLDTTAITPQTPVEQLDTLLGSRRGDVRRCAATRLAASPAGRRQLLLRMASRKNSVRSRIESYWANVVRALVEPYPQDMLTAPREILGDLPWEGRADAMNTASLWLADEYNLFRQFDAPATIPRRAFASITPFDPSQRAVDPPFELASIASDKLTEQISTSPFRAKGFEKQIHDPFYHYAMVLNLSRANHIESFRKWWNTNPNSSPLAKTIIVLAARRKAPSNRELISLFLTSPSPLVRRVVVQWIAEEHLKELRPQVEQVLDGTSMTADLFLATLAALEMLDGKDPKEFDKTPPGKYVLPLVKDEQRSAAVRAQALRLVDENDPALDAELMQSFLDNDSVSLQLEAVRTMQHSTAPFVGELLAAVAVDEQRPLGMRAEAIAGLAGRSYFPRKNAAVVSALDTLRMAKEPLLRLETLRSTRKQLTKTAKGRGTRLALLRTFAAAQSRDSRALAPGGSHRALAEQLALALSQAEIDIPDILKPVQTDRANTPAGWYALLETDQGDWAAGRRTFFHSQSAGCYRCHTVNGRGGQVGPDLSRIGGALSRRRLAESILEPSKEIAPQFISWTLLMQSGKVHTGMILGDTRDNLQRIGTATGEVVELKADQIEERHSQRKSLMPDNLHNNLTVTEFHDLLAFLESLK